jgi:hypothetical protein
MSSATLKQIKMIPIFMKETERIPSLLKRIKVKGACEKKNWAAPLMEVPSTECSNENCTASNQRNV